MAEKIASDISGQSAFELDQEQPKKNSLTPPFARLTATNFGQVVQHDAKSIGMIHHQPSASALIIPNRPKDDLTEKEILEGLVNEIEGVDSKADYHQVVDYQHGRRDVKKSTLTNYEAAKH